ncbi:MAG: HAMP domain-containing histidine kinase, partial [Candidatus Krumholzibacteria bacterium]|nr:HAMP domain-containing histidine kinase [Candidatus Krumholzibacteria bacterium]
QLRDHRLAQKLASLPSGILRDGSLRPLRDSMKLTAPVCLGDHIVGLVFLGPKISDRRYTEFDLELLNTLCAASAVTFNNAMLFENVRTSMKEVQRLSDLREEMISRIGHEFRTPLTAIKAALSCLSQSESEGPMPEIIASAADRLHALIDSLLILNSDDTVPLGAARHPFDPAAPIYEFISRYGEDAAAKDLTFEVRELVDVHEVFVSISADNFANVVERLLKNALKFSKEGTTIRAELEIVSREPDEELDGPIILDWKDQTRKTISDYKTLIEQSFRGASQSSTKAQGSEHESSAHFRGPYLVLKVSDSGIGIPRDDLQFIGEPFRQASNSPDQNVKGKALGLAVVQKVLSDCRARLCCRSEQDVGTTFSVFIPMV